MQQELLGLGCRGRSSCCIPQRRIVSIRMKDFELMYGHVMAAVKKCYYGFGLLGILAHMHGYQSSHETYASWKVVLGMLLLVVCFGCSKAHMKA